MTKETYKTLRAYMQAFEAAADKPVLDNQECDSADKISELCNALEAASQLSMIVREALRKERWYEEELEEQFNGGAGIDNP